MRYKSRFDDGPGFAPGAISKAAFLELVPEVLVIDFVMILDFLVLHDGTKQARAAVG